MRARSNSASVRRNDDVSIPFELLDRVCTKRGWWQELLGGEAAERCLSPDVEAALLGVCVCVCVCVVCGGGGGTGREREM